MPTLILLSALLVLVTVLLAVVGLVLLPFLVGRGIIRRSAPWMLPGA